MKTKHTIALCLLLATTACSSIQEEPVNTERAKGAADEVFYATLEQSGRAADATKVYADENLKVLWNADDRISIYNRYTYGYQYAFQGITGDSAGAFLKKEDDAEFVTGNPLEHIYAVYPYQEDNKINNSGQVSLTWPSTQTYKAESFGIGANVMVSVTDNNQLRFRNVGGYLAIKLYGDNVSVSSITLRGNNGEKLSGRATVTASSDADPALTFQPSSTKSIRLECPTPVPIGRTAQSATTFWMVVPPTQFAHGFNITVHTSDGLVFFKSTNNAYEIERNTLHRMAALEVIPTKYSPWKEFYMESSWSIIGSIASTGNSWDKDEPMYTTLYGHKHVARNILLRPSDQFKFRLDQNWSTNWGAPDGTGPLVLEVGLSTEATGDGNYFSVPVEGAYDVLLDEYAGTITLYEAYQTYPGFDEISSWSVIGSICNSSISWDKDIQMITDGEWNVAEGVILTTDDQFKFRQNLDWQYNIGAVGDYNPFVITLDEEYSGIVNGMNLVVPTDGVYDLLCKADGTFKVVESLGGKSPLVNPPEPEPVLVTGWSIIGLNGDWDNDILASQDGNVWTAYITATSDTDFKWRKDGGWDENYGGVMTALGEPFVAVPGGDVINVSAGFHKVILDLTDADAPAITVFYDFEVWSLIGDFNSWSDDVDLVESDGLWIAENVELTGSWKIRKNHGWNENRGGVFVSFGEPFAVAESSNSIDCGTGTFNVIYNPATETITITSAE